MFGFVLLLKSFLNWLMKVTVVQMISYLVDIESLNMSWDNGYDLCFGSKSIS